MPLNRTIIITFLLAALLICFGLWLQRQQPAAPAPKIIPVKTQTKQAVRQQAVFQKKLDSLIQKEKNIIGQLNNTRAMLSLAKEKNRKLQAQVKTLLSKDDSTLESADTGNCGTLKTSVGRLLSAQSEKDSLQDSFVVQMEWQLGNKDTIIAVQQQQYLSLKTAFDKSLQQQEILQSQKSHYKKEVRRQKRKKRLLLIGISAISFLSLSQLLKQ